MSLLTRKEKADLTRTEEYVRERIERTIKGISTGDVTFLDEIYYLIDARVEGLDNIGNVDVPFIDDQTPVETSLYNTLSEDIRELSELNIETIKDVFDGMNDVYNDIYSAGESITNSLSSCSELLSKVEGNLKRKMSLVSVKDEVTVLAMDNAINIGSSFVPSTSEDSETSNAISAEEAGAIYSGLGDATAEEVEEQGENSLIVDQNGGFITLDSDSIEIIDYSIDDITFNMPKGKISKPRSNIVDAKTFDFVQNGYFNSRIFSTDPVFENQYSSSTNALTDGDLGTTYLAEYNSLSSRTPLIMNMMLDVTDNNGNPRRVDHILVELSPGYRTSILSMDVKTPKLSKLSVDQVDVSSEVLDNSVYIQGTRVGNTRNRGFKTAVGTTYPVGSYLISKPNVRNISIGITADLPEDIFYPEKVLKGPTGNILRTMNYFETLILNGYEPPTGCPDPRDLFSMYQISSLEAEENAAYETYDQSIGLYRYFIEISDITLYSISYKTSGKIVIGNLNQNVDKKVASIELYTNETIPEGTTIRYYISSDKVQWYEIKPVNRASSSDLPTRIVYTNISSKDGDLFVNIDSSGVYMKIEMTGDGTVTPKIKAYAARIKLV